MLLKKYRNKGHKFDLLINSVPYGVFMCEKDDVLTVKFCNENFLSIIGYTKQELDAKFKNKFMNVIYKDDLGLAYKNIFQQLQQKDTFEIRLRIVKKDNIHAWIQLNGRVCKFNNKYYYNCSISNITKGVLSEHDKRIDEERYRIIAESSDSVIFEYNIKEKTVFYTNKFKQKFGEFPLINNIPDSIIDKGKIHSLDLKAFLSEYNKVLYGKSSGRIEIRLRKANGEFFWAQLRYTSIFDQNGVPAKVIGKIIDIDKQKKETESLKKANQMDSFTGLYNKTAILEHIEKYISENGEKKHALFFIDIDNFKVVNDSQGHIYGDKILFELSCVIKKQFRHTDLVGRIGGDEFLVFLKDYIDEDFIHEKAAALCQSISSIKTQLNNVRLTASVGITLYPKHGKLLAAIYEKADIALYAAKSEGKNKYKIYTQELAVKQYLSPYQAQKGDNKIMDIKKENIGDYTNFLLEVYDCLNCSDIDKAAEDALQMLGKKFNADRVYVYEFIGSNKVTNIYEWCGDKVKPLKDSSKNITMDKLSYQKYFNDVGFFYTSNADQFKDIQEFNIFNFFNNTSFLQCKITHKDTFIGFIGFDIINGLNMVTQEEMETLSFTAKAFGKLMKNTSKDIKNKTLT
ncbi:MAG: sensor domain-containing diguanylate cyclase [Clostridia bacterium]|nr:sensor domain-containing diguanylate cyclase [Clostridia bacterium]